MVQKENTKDIHRKSNVHSCTGQDWELAPSANMIEWRYCCWSAYFHTQFVT